MCYVAMEKLEVPVGFQLIVDILQIPGICEYVKKLNFVIRIFLMNIVDEITSGWRETVGGIYKKFNLHPDIVIYGKAIGNGYAISSILGKKKFMIYATLCYMNIIIIYHLHIRFQIHHQC